MSCHPLIDKKKDTVRILLFENKIKKFEGIPTKNRKKT